VKCTACGVAAIFVSSGLPKLTALDGFAANLAARVFRSCRYLHRLGPALRSSAASRATLGFASRERAADGHLRDHRDVRTAIGSSASRRDQFRKEFLHY
jgi:hypothetical protein